MIQRLIPPAIHRHWFTQLVLSGGGATVSLGAAAAPWYRPFVMFHTFELHDRRIPDRRECHSRRVTAVISPAHHLRSGRAAAVNKSEPAAPVASRRGTKEPKPRPPADLFHHRGALSIRSRFASSRLAGAVKTFSNACEIDSSGCTLRYSSALDISSP